MELVETLFNHKVKRITLLYVFLFNVLVGLFLVKYNFLFSKTLFLSVAILTPFIFKKTLISILVIGLLGFSLGLWRGSYIKNEINKYDSLIGESVQVYGRVADDPSYNDRKQTEFHITNTATDQGVELYGKIKVSVFGGSDLKRNDLIKVSGKLYEGYGNRQGSMYYAEFETIGRTNSPVEKFRQKYFAGVNSSLPEPQSSLGLGFLVGLKTLLPEDLLEILSITGLTHIVAVSGYNLTILVRYTRKFFMRFSKFIATAISVSLIIGFLAVTGISPSIARASIVSGFALLGWYYGREIKPMILILLGASITAFISPTYIWLDLGWWLSFLAFFGVLILAPLISGKLLKKEPGPIKRVMIETFSAQIFALPLIMLIFGELSLISIIANVLILPLIPLAMVLTFFAGIAGMLVPDIAGWVAFPAKILLTFMTELINLLSKVPYALIIIDISEFKFLAIMVVLILTTIVLAKKSGIKLRN